MAGVEAAHPIYEAFGAQVRERRTALRLTQQELAGRIELTRGSVANIEAGRQSVLLHQFLAIASALQLKPVELLPVVKEQPTIGEQTHMPDSVLDAVKAIRKSVGSRLPSRS
jgi:transcriptional regulator with XRE-family HTH domain